MHTLREKTFEELTTRELYRILQLRQDVFTIEQNCIWRDLDDRDFVASHVFAERAAPEAAIDGYVRLLAPGVAHDEASFGRLVVAPKARGLGLGKELVAAALETLDARYGGDVKISAQAQLERFYGDYGFVTVSAPYDDEGILHVDMIRTRRRPPAAGA